MVCPRLDQDKIAEAYKKLDDYMGETINVLKLNPYELDVVFAMMRSNIAQQNISAYMAETVTRFSEKLNQEDQDLK
jgi:hypothetical protein